MGEGLALLAEAPFITLAAINGHALGGGAEIAFSCDWRVMEKSAKMGFLQVDMALTTGWGGGARLLAEAGYARALDILSSGTAYPAEVWQAWGLVQRVVGAGKAYEEALAWAQTLAAKDLATLHALKAMLKAGRAPLAPVLEAERALFPDLWAAPAHAQAVQAFLERKNN
jgi:enoyl-CoA hydratase